MRDGHRVCMCECVQHTFYHSDQCARSRADLQISRRDSPESDPDSSWCVRYLSPLALFPELQPECCYGSLLQSDASVYASYLPSRRFLIPRLRLRLSLSLPPLVAAAQLSLNRP